ncbi:uncharacterized protein BDW43DRAFT_153293 [Aspergillus alliaceus]|uniref:uncharacterized protein n=1 Tax=Petromyces alliaceus TaxID=209559 RepID=UPI0012A41EA2|nr:uncharacterized protein BDW43DRAFT_153293 [Aspergillus alliaceus]KAB8238135.1 hypothetical protein BDW43DRAFT_153293 [Aspergillus alliaceus]
MGRKKSRTKRKVEPQWELDDEHRMLGCLDHCLAQGITDKLILKDRIRIYLKDAGKNFSVDRIDARLREMQDLAVPSRRKNIFVKGSGILKATNRWDDDEIKKYKDDQSSLEVAQLLNSRSRRFRETPQRAERRSTISNHSPHIEDGSMSSRHQIASTPVSRKRRCESNTPSRMRSTIPSKRRQEISRRSGSRTVRLKQEKQSPSCADSNPCLDNDDSLIPNSGSPSGGAIEGHSADAEQSTRPSCNSHPHDPNSESVSERPLVQEPESLRKKDRNLEIRLGSISAMHVLSRKELSSVRAEYVKASDVIRSLQRAIAEVKQGTESRVANALAYQEKRIDFLERLLEDTQKSASFARMDIDSRSPTGSQISELMMKMHTEIRKIMCLASQDRTLQVPLLNENDHLSSLLRRIMGLSLQQSAGIKSVLSNLDNLELEAVLCALTTAAICEWVFEDDVESDTTTPSLLLDMYRHHVSLVNGEVALRRLDLAAHHSLFNSQDYHKINIPTYAQALVTRLRNALVPLFGTPNEPSETQCLDTWGLEHDEGQLVDEGLVDVFKFALALKAMLLASSHQFLVVLFAPGLEFSDYCMQAESREGFRITEFPSDPAKVQLCVLPAIFASSEERSGLIEYKVEVSTSPDSMQGKHFRLVQKGVVII